MPQRQVFVAQPYDPGQLGSLGKAAYMYIRQFQFPFEYDARDGYTAADHDRLLGGDYRHARTCIESQTGSGEGALGDWVRRAYDNKIMYFLQQLLQPDTAMVWTGYRVLGSVHRGTGYPVWTLELFAKHPDTKTLVYTGPDAPNVRSPSMGDPPRDPYRY